MCVQLQGLTHSEFYRHDTGMGRFSLWGHFNTSLCLWNTSALESDWRCFYYQNPLARWTLAEALGTFLRSNIKIRWKVFHPLQLDMSDSLFFCHPGPWGGAQTATCWLQSIAKLTNLRWLPTHEHAQLLYVRTTDDQDRGAACRDGASGLCSGGASPDSDGLARFYQAKRGCNRTRQYGAASLMTQHQKCLFSLSVIL